MSAWADPDGSLCRLIGEVEDMRREMLERLGREVIDAVVGVEPDAVVFQPGRVGNEVVFVRVEYRLPYIDGSVAAPEDSDASE